MVKNKFSSHPLDPLNSFELKEVVKHARNLWKLDHRHLFAMVQLHEPSKEVINNWKSSDQVERAAKITLWNSATSTVIEAVITVEGKEISFTEIPGAKAPILSTESEKAIKAAKADKRIIAALKDRGINDLNQVHMETWPIGAQIPKDLDDGRRLIWTPMWQRPTEFANLYAHPINGLHAIVDLDSGEVVFVENTEIIPIPQTPGPYRENQTGANIKLKDLAIVQSEGPSFSVEGWKVNWERWNLRVGFCQREGLVIHDVKFKDQDKERKIAHRLSIAELVIPYGDPSQGAYRKNAFDTGEFGLGNYTNSLTLGCDCLGEIVYLDAAVTTPNGSIKEIPNAICMHEEDNGILWKHVDADGHTEVRRGRRFVVSSIVTVNNYEYGYFWYFYQDGTIEFEAKLTGIVLTVADAIGKDHPSATELEPGLWAPYHQHILCARLDLDIDGEKNSVLEVESFAHPQ